MTTKQYELEYIIDKIENEIDFVDVKPYSHNIIALWLKILEEQYGKDEVFEIINNSDLYHLGWGHIVDEQIEEWKKKAAEKMAKKKKLKIVNSSDN